jgi:hypothetical protein
MISFIRRLFEQPPAELVRAHALAVKNFIYIDQSGEGQVYKAHDITKPFQGDCDDWACSLALALKGDAHYIEFYLPFNRYHAVCTYKGWVSDNTRKGPYRASEIKSIRRSYDWEIIRGLTRKIA